MVMVEVTYIFFCHAADEENGSPLVKDHVYLSKEIPGLQLAQSLGVSFRWKRKMTSFPTASSLLKDAGDKGG